jgi:hypothetical protein
MSNCSFALIFAFVLSATACKGTQGTDPTVPPQDSTVTAPRGVATLDGTFSDGEWTGAYTAPLTSGGEVRLMHDGGYLYLGVQRRGALVVTVCLDRGDSMAVLHSSAALGTATYRRAQSGWNLARGFTWELRDSTMSAAAQQEREAFLQREGWVATIAYLGADTDTEFKIAMPLGRVRLTVIPMSVGQTYQETAWWPGRIADGCRSIDLLSGDPPAQLQFAPESWMTVVAGQ